VKRIETKSALLALCRMYVNCKLVKDTDSVLYSFVQIVIL